MDNENQGFPPIPNKQEIKTAKNLSFAKTLSYGFVIVSVGISIAIGGYLLGANKTKPQSTVQVFSTPTPTIDQTANWKTYEMKSLRLTFRLPPELIASGEFNEKIIQAVQPFSGTAPCMTFTPALSKDCEFESFGIRTTSSDWNVPREGPSFIELQGFMIKKNKYYAKFGKEEIEIPSELVQEVKNKNGISMVKILGKDNNTYYQFGRPVYGTPGYGNIGALVNTNDKTYPGFAIQMKLYQDWNEITFDQILSTFKFTK